MGVPLPTLNAGSAAMAVTALFFAVSAVVSLYGLVTRALPSPLFLLLSAISLASSLLLVREFFGAFIAYASLGGAGGEGGEGEEV